MNFKIVILLGLSIYLTSSAFSQTIKEANEKLKLETIKTATPDDTEFETILLDNSWYVTEFPVSKAVDSRDRYNDITIKDIDNIEISALDLELKEDDYQYFRINGGDKMLVLRSKNHTRKLIQKQSNNAK